MSYQYYAMNGDRLNPPIKMPDILDDVFELSMPTPPGLVDVDKSTGLVKVLLTCNKQTHMKMGKLLLKTGSTSEQCQNYSSKLRAIILGMKGAKVEFTEGGDEAYDIYEEGPHSCMVGCEAVRAYDSDNIAVAYVRVGERVLARAVVCTDEELGLRYSTIYGNEDLLRPLLEEAGYKYGDLIGCTMDRIICDRTGAVMSPWLDCDSMVTDTGSELEISAHGEYSSQNESGLLGVVCEGCRDISHPDDIMYEEYEEVSLCSSCYDDVMVYVEGELINMNNPSIVETHDGDYIMLENSITTADGEVCHIDDVAYSDYSGEYYLHNEVTLAITNMGYPEGETCYKEDCTEEEGVWVHDDILDEHIEEQDRQLKLELEDVSNT